MLSRISVNATKMPFPIYSRIVRTLNLPSILGEKRCALYAGNYGILYNYLFKADIATIINHHHAYGTDVYSIPVKRFWFDYRISQDQEST